MSDLPPGAGGGRPVAPCRRWSPHERIALTERSHPEAPTMVRMRRRAALAVICLGAGLLISLGAVRS